MKPAKIFFAAVVTATLVGCAHPNYRQHGTSDAPCPVPGHEMGPGKGAGMHGSGGMMHQGGAMAGQGMHGNTGMHGDKGAMRQQHFQMMDRNQDGEVSRDEYQQFHADHFEQMDQDQDGKLKAGDMKMPMMNNP